MENWNNNEWQGRRKDQYESSAKYVFYCIVAFAVIFLTSIFLA
jgi:uncharacterized membrane protein YidH (DUF202 family)